MVPFTNGWVTVVVFLLAMCRRIKSGLGGMDRASAIKTKVSGLSNPRLRLAVLAAPRRCWPVQKNVANNEVDDIKR